VPTLGADGAIILLLAPLKKGTPAAVAARLQRKARGLLLKI
jgi:hypothetical protein